MPSGLKRYYGDGHLHFVTFSCFRRRAFLSTARRKDLVLRMLEQTRVSYGFVVVGYVGMPEHVHFLVSEPVRKDLSTAIKAFKQAQLTQEECCADLAVRGSASAALLADPFLRLQRIHGEETDRKLRYMHRNPVKRGFIDRAEDWRWSSYRSYAYGEPGLVQLNVARPAKIQTRAASV